MTSGVHLNLNQEYTGPEVFEMIQKIEAAKDEEFSNRQEEYEKEINILREQLRLMQNHRFGRSSEKGSQFDHPDQLQLFPLGDEEQETIPSEEKEQKTITVKSHRRKKGGRQPFPDFFPEETLELDIPEEDKTCGCGCLKERIGSEESRRLDYIPAQIKILRTVRHKYICKNCEGLEDHGKPVVSVVPAPKHIIPRCLVSSRFLAMVMIGKYQDAIPFYRQENQLKRLQLDLPRATMAGWAIKIANALSDFIQLLHQNLLQSRVIQMDETTLQVLKEKGREPTTLSYLWVMKGGPPGKEIRYFHYAPSRSGEIAKTLLEHFQGVVQCDGYKGYDWMVRIDTIIRAGCMAHARRKFVEALKARSGGKKKKGNKKDRAQLVLDQIGELYKLEKRAKQEGLSDEERKVFRQKEARPILENLKQWLQDHKKIVVPSSLLGKAVDYMLKSWDRLTVYLDYGYVEIDNNGVENSIRPVAVGRKNYLFSDSEGGAHALAVMYTLIETAKANRIEPFEYLSMLFEKIPYADSKEDLQRLFPWNLDPITHGLDTCA
ncbi:MAG: IS66 family transposase [SAR324 cluster bacterium]|nr:IS66 family transposase [SAR324 cluster bacterium]